MIRVYGNNWTLVSGPLQDDSWTVIEYPDGQEITVELKPSASAPEAKGTARVMRRGNETSISLDVSGLTGDESAYHVYLVDSLGNTTELGSLTISDGSASLSGNTALTKFMIVVSPEADLTTIVSETKVALRSTVPSGFTVVPKEKGGEIENPEATSTPQMEPAATETPEYDAPLLGIGSLKRGANTMMRAQLSSGFEGARANISIKPQKNGPTQIKIRFTYLKEAPEGTQYLLWEVTPEGSYSLLGRLTPTGKKNETKVDAQTALPDFGLFITAEGAEANPSSPGGGMIATIIK